MKNLKVVQAWSEFEAEATNGRFITVNIRNQIFGENHECFNYQKQLLEKKKELYISRAEKQAEEMVLGDGKGKSSGNTRSLWNQKCVRAGGKAPGLGRGA